MKELKNKKAYADITFSINLRVTYDDVHDEPVTVEDIEAMDFLEKIGMDEIVMSRIWGDIADGSYWGMFDYEYEQSQWVSIDWDLDGNNFTVSFEDDDVCPLYVDISCKEFTAEFFDIFEVYIDNAAFRKKYINCLSHYWETEFDLENYPSLLTEIEKLTGYNVTDK